jgi:hypothetical protein
MKYRICSKLNQDLKVVYFSQCFLDPNWVDLGTPSKDLTVIQIEIENRIKQDTLEQQIKEYGIRVVKEY